MNEKFNFNINKKIDQKEYRKNLADELRNKIVESGFKESREHLKSKKEEGTVYDKAKEEKLAQWLIQKYITNPDIFRDQDLTQLKAKEIHGKIYSRKNEIQNEKPEDKKRGYGGVSPKHSEGVYNRVTDTFFAKKFENDSNLQKLKGPHSDIILKPDNPDNEYSDNKYILLEVIQPQINVNFIEDLYSSWNIDKSEEEGYNLLRNQYLKTQQEGDKGEFGNNTLKFKTLKSIFKKNLLSAVVVARPLGEYGFDQHKEIAADFIKNRDLKEDPHSKNIFLKEMPTLSEKKIDELEGKFIVGIVSIIIEESDYVEALNKLRKLSIPDNFKPYISVTGGGMMRFNNEGTIIVEGQSEKYGEADKSKVLEILKNDFPDKKFE